MTTKTVCVTITKLYN